MKRVIRVYEKEGKIVIQDIYGTQEIIIPLGEALKISKEIGTEAIKAAVGSIDAPEIPFDADELSKL